MRLLKICYTLAKYLVFYKTTRHRKKILGERLKLAFEQLGITFIKIGQALSMRYDILPREDCEALQQLLDDTNPIDFSIIANVLEKEYGKPHTKVFASFDKNPIGCASVSQVHKATLRDGRIAAVKIKRPRVDRYLRQDIRILKCLALLGTTMSPTLRGLRVREVVRFFEAWINQDVDFSHEVASIKHLRRQAESSTDHSTGKIYCMDVFEDLCTENIVVMEFVEGIPLSRKEEILNNPDYDIEETIHNLVNSAIKSWFIDETEGHYFQADPHLSNILALPGGGVANIDCGLVQRLSRRETRICKNLMLAIYFKDTDRLVRVMTDMCGVDYRKYKDVLADDVTFYLEKVDDEGLGFWFFELTKIFVKHKIDYPTFMITLGRGNVILDGLISTYLPHYSTLDVLGRQLSKRANEHFRDTFDEKYFLRASYALIERAKIKFEKTDPFKESLQLLSDIAQAARGTYK